MQVKDLGEFGVIELLNRLVISQRSGPDNGASFSFNLLVDTGDDTAVWETGQARELFTTDTMVEGVHFTRETTPWRDLGWKSIASNVSDVASMGGLPTYALITLGLPPETEVDNLKELYSGMLELGNRFGVAIVGGDMVRSPVVFITVSLTGVMNGEPMLRTNARPSDLVAVTGFLGGSGAGLRLMQQFPQQSGNAAEYLRTCHRHPLPAVSAGRLLADSGITTAMDVSDGLFDDLSKLSRASGVSARVCADQLPVNQFVRECFPDDWLELALGGGEDYVLLFTGPKAKVEAAVTSLGEGAAVIGEIEEGEPGLITVVGASGEEISLPAHGWDHFR
jgi:thiamine-monophosphate kinase